MGKNKLARFAEMKSFSNVLEPPSAGMKTGIYPMKGRWKEAFFGNNNPITLELGCGKGEYTVGLAMKYPSRNHIGIDIKGARMWRGAKTAVENKIPNVLFLRTRIEFIHSFFDEDEIDEIWVTFPDPFTKPVDYGKRLSSSPFLNSYRKIIRNRGLVHLKTDNLPLYLYTRTLVAANNLEIVTDTSDLYGSGIENEILTIRTHYENLFLRDGVKINYLSFRLDKNREIREAHSKK